MAQNRTPHFRLKKLRKIIGFTQEKLAEKCGISYPYLLSVETGQRPISEKLARRISFATGVSKEWLMYDASTTDEPTGYFGAYDKSSWERYCKWDASKNPGHDFGDVGDEMLDSDDAIYELGSALRAAWRLGKFNVAVMMVRDLVKTMEKDLKLTTILNKERHNDIPAEVLDSDLAGRNHLTIHLLLPHISPFARYKWCKAFEEGGQKEEVFIEEFSELHRIIVESFDLRDGKEKP